MSSFRSNSLTSAIDFQFRIDFVRAKMLEEASITIAVGCAMAQTFGRHMTVL
jgi:hypothetical protein